MAVSELFVQSVGDTIRVFSAWPKDKPAEFRNLRAQGGFLVSAETTGGGVTGVEVTSTVGGSLRLLSAWEKVSLGRRSGSEQVELQEDGVVLVETEVGERVTFQPRETGGGK